MAIDEARLHEFLGRFVGDLGATEAGVADRAGFEVARPPPSPARATTW